MNFDDKIANIKERNRLRNITHPIGAVYRGDEGYFRVCFHGTTINRFTDYTGNVRSISSGLTSERISKLEYMKAVFLGKKVKEIAEEDK